LELTAAGFCICFGESSDCGRYSKSPYFKEYTVNEDRFKADIKVPAIEGLENKELQNSLNEKYLAENKKLYEEFMAEMENMKKEEAVILE